MSWLIKQGLAVSNPLKGVDPVDTRQMEQFRRALSPEEAQRLLDVAPKKRRVVYLVALQLGLRRNEIRSLKLQDFFFDGPQPYVRVPASIAKNRKTEDLPMGSELVAAVRSILPDCPMPFEIVFRGMVPKVPTLRRDLVKAGIAFKDDRGRRIDLHSLRVTMNTNLLAAGVPLAITMKLVRHSDPRLTLRNYLDTARLPLAEAIAKAPQFTVVNAVKKGTANGAVEGTETRVTA